MGPGPFAMIKIASIGCGGVIVVSSSSTTAGHPVRLRLSDSTTRRGTRRGTRAKHCSCLHVHVTCEGGALFYGMERKGTVRRRLLCKLLGNSYRAAAAALSPIPFLHYTIYA